MAKLKEFRVAVQSLTVDEAIRQAGGERAAIRGLILGQRQLLDQIDRSVSTGYVRGRRG